VNRKLKDLIIKNIPDQELREIIAVYRRKIVSDDLRELYCKDEGSIVKLKTLKIVK